jgi:Kef-type K+ transport system membrane component KefB
MIPRGEMALITAQIGFSQHILSDNYYSTIIFTISLVTLIAPLFLKAALRGAPAKGEAAGAEAAYEAEAANGIGAAATVA